MADCHCPKQESECEWSGDTQTTHDRRALHPDTLSAKFRRKVSPNWGAAWAQSGTFTNPDKTVDFLGLSVANDVTSRTSTLPVPISRPSLLRT